MSALTHFAETEKTQRQQSSTTEPADISTRNGHPLVNGESPENGSFAVVDSDTPARNGHKPATRRGSRAKDGESMPKKAHSRSEQKLDEGIRRLIGKDRSSYKTEQWRGIREHYRIDVLYPGNYVVYRNHWKGEGSSLRLTREVLFASPNLEDAQACFDDLNLDEQRDTFLYYVESHKTSRRR